MGNREVNIGLIKAYINGELNATESLFVEQKLAEEEQWQDVYEGLLFAEKQALFTNEIASELEKQLTTDHKAKRVELRSWKRWTTVAAALVGILIISYATVYFLSPNPQEQTAMVQSSGEDDFSQQNQIEIIEPDYSVSPRIRSAKSDTESAEASKSGASEPAPPDKILQPQDIAIDEVPDLEPQKMTNYLARNGYRQMRFQAVAASSPVVSDALPMEGITEFEKQNARNFIARFPMNGIVELSFLVNADGQLSDIDVIQSFGKEGTEVVKELLLDKTEWSPAISSTGKAVSQRKRMKVSFGNTVFVELVEF